MRPALVFLCWLFCVSPAAAAERTVLAVNIGWHVGLAFEAADLDPAAFPEAADFPDARWIEVGWGDAAFYRDPDPGLGTILAAALVPTPAVLHLVGMPAHPAQYLPGAEVLAIPLDDAQLARLVAYVAAQVDRAGRPRADALGPGLYPVSRFYPALGEFSLERTCNTWVAEAMAAAGLPIDPGGVVQAGTLMARVRAALGIRPEPVPEPSELR
jgi:uncharacterized protein (TIGR02117 family)